jgi:hypothetical protein
MKAFVITILTVFVLVVFGAIIVKSVSLEQNCIGYLKRAADANTVETASSELEKAIKYLDDNNLTSGYTSALWRTPDEDISFWYKNLKSSQLELSKVTDSTSQLERTNLLMKLRETLLDNGKDGDSITVPDGLSRYPNNFAWGLLFWLAFILAIGLMSYATITKY